MRLFQLSRIRRGPDCRSPCCRCLWPQAAPTPDDCDCCRDRRRTCALGLFDRLTGFKRKRAPVAERPEVASLARCWEERLPRVVHFKLNRMWRVLEPDDL